MSKIKIPFNKPSFTGKELDYIAASVQSGKISGDGMFTGKCQRLMEKKFRVKKVLLTTSCTDALELASLLINLDSQSEVILPSYTFASTANAVLLRGARPVFIDIRKDTLNLDEAEVEAAITPKTRAIFPVHYAGMACAMDKIMALAKKHCLFLIEDAAQAIGTQYNGEYCGTLGTFGCFSFHETKNVIAGEGGALLINDEGFIERAEIIRDKGTNRSQFFRGEVKKYRWVDLGSSFLPSDILAAFLYAQLESFDEIQKKRKALFERYRKAFEPFESKGLFQTPAIPEKCKPNYHMFYLIVKSEQTRDRLAAYLKTKGILSVSHYQPLHLSPMGQKLGYHKGDFPMTEDLSKRLLRLPFYNAMTFSEQDYVILHVRQFIKKPQPKKIRDKLPSLPRHPRTETPVLKSPSRGCGCLRFQSQARKKEAGKNKSKSANQRYFLMGKKSP